jgi:tRNA threonylcarbamoyladenosine biosynthesis protein TsaB
LLNEREPLILAIETATRAGSVTLAHGARVLASVSGDVSSSHSTDLIQNIATILHQAEKALRQVDVFAGAAGPGSFTGLRIGLATVKSLAVSMDQKCIGVSTLAAIAVAAGNSDRTVALLPAGRGEVFAQMFAVCPEAVEPLDAATHITPQRLLAKYGNDPQVRWAGEGAHLQLEMLRKEAAARGVNFEPYPDEPRAAQSNGWTLAPRQDKLAEAVAKLALREWRAGKLIDPENLRANYLRPSDAELKTNV